MLIQTQLNGIELDSIEGGWREAVDEERLLFSYSFRSCQANGWATFPRQKLNFRHSDYDQVKNESREHRKSTEISSSDTLTHLTASSSELEDLSKEREPL